MVRTSIKRIIPKVSMVTNPLKKSRQPVSLRTDREQQRYSKAQKLGIAGKPFLEEERLREWKYWALIDNAFPYNAAFKLHHLLIPKRVTSYSRLSDEERAELDRITDELGGEQEYDCVLSNFPRTQSIKDHFHLHFLVYKDRRKHLKF